MIMRCEKMMSTGILLNIGVKHRLSIQIYVLHNLYLQWCFTLGRVAVHIAYIPTWCQAGYGL